MFGVFAQDNPCPPGFGVSRTVVEGFLNDAIDTGFIFFREIIVEIGIDDFHHQAGAFGKFASLPLDRGHQTKIVEHRGPEQERSIPDFVEAIFGQQPDLVQSIPRSLQRLGIVDQLPHIYEQRCQCLCNLVGAALGKLHAVLLLERRPGVSRAP